MNVTDLTRALVDIESITENEEACGLFLLEVLSEMAERHGGKVERMDVAPRRFNIFAQFGPEPTVTLTTHYDTVPPFFPSSEDEQYIYGRGSCDAKGILAAMIVAAEELLRESPTAGLTPDASTPDALMPSTQYPIPFPGLGLLFVVGEERGSAGAIHAATTPRGSRHVVNGEPTENRIALGSKGALRLEVTATGKMAHSAYPELGESAIEKLLDALQNIRSLELPTHQTLGPCTLNIGTIHAGRAPNVIPDEAKAEILVRLVEEPQPVKEAIEKACQGKAEVHEVLCIPAEFFGEVPGIDSTVVAYTTDIPAFKGAWGRPYLLGPGTIHVAHTENERIAKKDLAEAVERYKQIVRYLWDLESSER